MNKKQSKKLKKSPKKNFLFQSFGLGTILLTAFSMFSSGFSSWVIVREGKESINLGLEVEDTVKPIGFIPIDNRPSIEITPNGFVIDETLTDGKYAFEFDVPFKFEFDLSKLHDYLSEEVKIKVTAKNEITTDFGLFQSSFMAYPDELSVSAKTIDDNKDVSKHVSQEGEGYVDTKSFVKTLSFKKINIEKDVEFLLTYHFDFSNYFNDGVALPSFVKSVYDNFPETGNTLNFLNFILEVEISL